MKKLSVYRQTLADDGHCMSDSDGDCSWSECPQNVASTRQSHCPRDIATRRRLDPDDEGRAGNG
jgi:hypothetical protein